MTRGFLGPRGCPETPGREGERRKTGNHVRSGRRARLPRSGEGTLRLLLGTGRPPSTTCTAPRGGGPGSTSTPSTVLPRAAQAAGPGRGTGLLCAQAPLPQPRGPGSAPRQGGGHLPGNHPQGRCAPPSETLLHPQAVLPEAPAGPLDHSLPALGVSVHPCPPACPGEVGHPEPRAFPHCTSPASPAPSRRPGACPHPVPPRGRQARMWLPGGRVQASGGQAPEQSAPGVWRRGPRGWGTSRRPRPHCPPGGLGDPCRAPLFILAPVPFLTAASPEPRNCHELVIKPTARSIQCLHRWAQLLGPQGGRPGRVGSPLAEAGQRCCPRAAQGVLQPKAHLWLPPSAGFTRYQYHQQDRPPGPLTSCESCPGPADQTCRQTGGHQGPKCWEGCPGLASGLGAGEERRSPHRTPSPKAGLPCKARQPLS